MIHVYFKHRPDTQLLNSIHDWASKNFGLNFPLNGAPDPAWKWIKATESFGDIKIIGIVLPDAESVNVLVIKFPIEVSSMFETIEYFNLENG